MSLSVCLSVRLSIRPSVHPSVRLSYRPSVCPSVRPSVRLPVHPSVRPSICPSVRLSLRPSGIPKLGGPQEKMPFFQVALGPILRSSIHSNSSQYDPCKVWLKKMTTSLPAVPLKFTFLCVLVTELVTELIPLGTDPVLAWDFQGCRPPLIDSHIYIGYI
jgi:hypothetical protein